jgi:pimeloyl-ACP methyl ester carboxylesterase
MLHGFMQSSPIFRAKTAALRKSLDKICAFDYVQAPHVLTTADEFKHKAHILSASGDGTVPENTYYAWWKMTSAQPDRYTGWHASVEHLRAHVARHGAYDVYWGFSQGASFLALLAALASAQRSCPAKFAELARKHGAEAQGMDYSWFLAPPPFPAASAALGHASAADSASATAFSVPSPSSSPRSPPLLVFVSGFVPRVRHLRQFFPQPLAADGASVAAAPLDGAALLPQDNKGPCFEYEPDLPLIDCPSLHVLGRSDADVSPLESDALRRAFLNGCVEAHEGGHVVPNNAEFCRRYKKFFAEKTGMQV